MEPYYGDFTCTIIVSNSISKELLLRLEKLSNDLIHAYEREKLNYDNLKQKGGVPGVTIPGILRVVYRDHAKYDEIFYGEGLPNINIVKTSEIDNKSLSPNNWLVFIVIDESFPGTFNDCIRRCIGNRTLAVYISTNRNHSVSLGSNDILVTLHEGQQPDVTLHVIQEIISAFMYFQYISLSTEDLKIYSKLTLKTITFKTKCSFKNEYPKEDLHHLNKLRSAKYVLIIFRFNPSSFKFSNFCNTVDKIIEHILAVADKNVYIFATDNSTLEMDCAYSATILYC